MNKKEIVFVPFHFKDRLLLLINAKKKKKIVGDFSYRFLKRSENYGLKSVVETCVYGIHKAKNVFSTMFQITCFSM